MDKNNGDKKKTAADLGISLKTLYNRLNEYNEEPQAQVVDDNG